MKSNVGIMDLTPSMCACIVPEEPYPQYCGLPATHWPRMCQHHAKAYLNFRQNNDPKKPKPKRSAIAFRAVRV